MRDSFEEYVIARGDALLRFAYVLSGDRHLAILYAGPLETSILITLADGRVLRVEGTLNAEDLTAVAESVEVTAAARAG